MQLECDPSEDQRHFFTVDGTVYMLLMGHLRGYLVGLNPVLSLFQHLDTDRNVRHAVMSVHVSVQCLV